MRLDDIEPNTFGTFIHSLYTKEIQLNNGNPGRAVLALKTNSAATNPTALVLELGQYTVKCLLFEKLWTAAQQFLVPKLQNQVMNQLSPRIMLGGSLNMFVSYVYEHIQTTRHSRMWL